MFLLLFFFSNASWGGRNSLLKWGCLMLVMWGGNPKTSLCWATPLDNLIWVVFRRGNWWKYDGWIQGGSQGRHHLLKAFEGLSAAFEVLFKGFLKPFLKPLKVIRRPRSYVELPKVIRRPRSYVELPTWRFSSSHGCFIFFIFLLLVRMVAASRHEDDWRLCHEELDLQCFN